MEAGKAETRVALNTMPPQGQRGTEDEMPSKIERAGRGRQHRRSEEGRTAGGSQIAAHRKCFCRRSLRRFMYFKLDVCQERPAATARPWS